MKKLILTVLMCLVCGVGWGGVDLEADSSQYLSQADGLSTDISGADQSISIALWVEYESTTGSSQQHMIAKYDTATNQRAYRFSRTNATRFLICTLSPDGGASVTSSTAGTAVSNNVPHQVTCVYNDTDIRIYLDGALDSSATNPQAYTAGLFDASSSLGIGAQAIGGTPTGFADGIIEDICIWNSALTASEVFQLAKAKIKGICRQIQPTKLKLYCSMDSCPNGTICSTYNCLVGSNLTAVASPVGAAGKILSYP